MNPFNNKEKPGLLHPIPADWTATLAYGANKEAKKGDWKPHTVDLESLRSGLTNHIVGSKDGRAFLQGTCAQGHRIAKAMTALYIIGIDVDNGMPSDVIDKIVRERGLYCVRYTTHSHGKNYTEVRHDDWVRYQRANPETTIGEYLQAKKRYLPEVTQDAQIISQDMTSNGVVLKVSHPPMDKNRLVFILSKPWVLDEYLASGKTQDEAIKDWKDAYLNFCAWLGIEVDQSVTDSSRLFYSPRYEKGSPYESVVHEGMAINIFAIPQQGNKGSNAFLDAASSMGVRDDGGSETLRRVKKWAMQFNGKERFQIYDALADYAEHVLRPEKDSEGKHHIECPWESEHTTLGGHGTFVMNADDSNKGTFIISCQHNGCRSSNRGPLDFLAQMIDNGWIPEEALYDDRYLLELEEGQSPLQPTSTTTTEPRPPLAPLPSPDSDDPVARITVEDVEEHLRKLAETEASDLKADQMIEILAKASHLNKTSLNKTLGKYRQDVKRKKKEEEAERAAREAERRKITNEKEKAAESKILDVNPDRPTIYVDTDFLLAASKSLKALEESNNANEHVFRFAGGLARVTQDEYGLWLAQRYDTKIMRYELARVIRYMRTQGDDLREVPPPVEIVDDILSESNPPFPALYGIANAPVFGRDGKLLTTPGYSHSSQIFFAAPDNFDIPRVPMNPTAEEVDKALDLLMDNALVDFPFDGPDDGAAEKAHALCMILQPFVRQLIDGPTPIYLIAKPTPGTGASKLVGIYSLITHGESAIAQTEAKQEDEIRKRITSVLAEGRNTFYLDNVNHKVDSSALASAVTSEMWTDRLLGETKTVRVPVRLTWIIAGNNPMLSNEIARRCVRTRLDAKVERPEDRRGFKHVDLEGWVKANRSQLVWACLTLVQKWLADGRPAPDKTKGSFEAWSNVLGGILKACGIPGFLGNDADMRAEADEEGGAIKSYLALWWDKYRDQATTIGGGVGMDEGLVGLVQETDAALPVHGNTDRALKISLGKYLGKMKGRMFTLNDGATDISVEINQMPPKDGTTRWRLKTVKVPGAE